MKLSNVLVPLAFTASSVTASAAGATAFGALTAQAETTALAMEAAGCKIAKCIAAAAPMLVTCAAALAQEGWNPLADLACIAAVANNLSNPPAACKGCP